MAIKPQPSKKAPAYENKKDLIADRKQGIKENSPRDNRMDKKGK